MRAQRWPTLELNCSHVPSRARTSVRGRRVEKWLMVGGGKREARGIEEDAPFLYLQLLLGRVEWRHESGGVLKSYVDERQLGQANDGSTDLFPRLSGLNKPFNLVISITELLSLTLMRNICSTLVRTLPP